MHRDKRIAHQEMDRRSGLVVDLQKIEKESNETYQMILAERPARLPWSSYAGELAQTDLEQAPFIKMIIDKVPELIKTEPFVYTPEIKGADKESRELLIEECANSLEAIGIHISSLELVEPFEQSVEMTCAKMNIFGPGTETEDSLYEIVCKIQEEFAGVTHATRIIEETKMVFARYAPQVPWPSQTILGSGRQTNETNAAWRPREKSGHFVSLKDPEGDVETCLKESKDPSLLVDGFFKIILISSSHEIGHAVFAELFEDKQIRKIFGSVPDEASISWALTEGYGIIYERIMSEIMDFENPKVPDNQLDYVAIDANNRRNYLYNSRADIKARAYTDGDKIMRKLILQLGLYNKSKQEQLLGLNEFLKTVDIVKVAGIRQNEKQYESIVNNPLNLLPQKDTSRSTLYN